MSAAATPRPGLPDAARPLRLLYVEDHDDTARILARLLSNRGHHVHVSSGVADALQSAAEQRFDLVVSDLGLSDGDGCELMSRLRQEHGLRGIAVSGLAGPTELERSRAAGFHAHLVKPVCFDSLCGEIERLGPSPEAITSDLHEV